MPLNRRQFLVTSAAVGGGALLARPAGALAQTLDPGLSATSRVSRLFPAMRLAHGDLHNHTVRSDGAGDPAAAFGSMRAAGLDFAALTDHASVAKAQGALGTCAGDACGLLGINETSWAEAGVLANAANDDGTFTAIRGFEWSSPQLGHINTWFSSTWIDPLATGGVDVTSGNVQLLTDGGLPLTPAQAALLTSTLGPLPTTMAGMVGFQNWLKLPPGTPGTGGGADAIAGFNHPGREPGRYGQFAFDPALRPRIVSIEVFNRGEDYLFEGVGPDNPSIESPIQQCLNAGWTPGLAGVTDEHGTNWGTPEGNGRTGIYISSLTRDGIRSGMERRHFFATRLRGLRIDASANGQPMGGTVPHTSGPMTFQLDVDRGVTWYGRRLQVQVLQAGRNGDRLPHVVQNVLVDVPAPTEPVITFTVPINRADGGWVILRISDPASTDLNPGAGNKQIREDGRAAGTAYAGKGPAIAYASPFYLTADAPPVVPEVPAAVLLPAAAALGLGAAYVIGKRHQHDGEDAGHEHGAHA